MSGSEAYATVSLLVLIGLGISFLWGCSGAERFR